MHLNRTAPLWPDILVDEAALYGGEPNHAISLLNLQALSVAFIVLLLYLLFFGIYFLLLDMRCKIFSFSVFAVLAIITNYIIKKSWLTLISAYLSKHLWESFFLALDRWQSLRVEVCSLSSFSEVEPCLGIRFAWWIG